MRCGRRIPVENERPRNLVLERELTDLAARAAGFPHDGGLGAFADSRADPGGLRTVDDAGRPRDWIREASEEQADLRFYLLAAIDEVWDAYLAGEPEACNVYSRAIEALKLTIAAWWALHG